MKDSGIELIKELLDTPEYHDIGEKLFESLSSEEKNRLWTLRSGFAFQGYPFRDETKLKQNCKEVKE